MLSGIAGKAEILDAARRGGLGGTYAGNPLGVTAALAVLDVIKEEKILDRSQLLVIAFVSSLLILMHLKLLIFAVLVQWLRLNLVMMKIQIAHLQAKYKKLQWKIT